MTESRGMDEPFLLSIPYLVNLRDWALLSRRPTSDALPRRTSPCCSTSIMSASANALCSAPVSKKPLGPW